MLLDSLSDSLSMGRASFVSFEHLELHIPAVASAAANASIEVAHAFQECNGRVSVVEPVLCVNAMQLLAVRLNAMQNASKLQCAQTTITSKNRDLRENIASRLSYYGERTRVPSRHCVSRVRVGSQIAPLAAASTAEVSLWSASAFSSAFRSLELSLLMALFTSDQFAFGKAARMLPTVAVCACMNLSSAGNGTSNSVLARCTMPAISSCRVQVHI